MLIRKGKIIDVPQGSSEWLELRRGKVTGTSAYTVLTFGKGKDALIDRLVIESISSADFNGFKSDAMKRGNELEPEAALEFEIRNGFPNVVEVGMVQHERIDGFLVSPDRLVEPYQGLEIKCFEAKNYYEHLKAYKADRRNFRFLDNQYNVQVQACLTCTGNDIWYGVIYNPDFAGNEYIQFEIERDDAMIAELEEKVEIVLEERDKRIKEMM